MSEHAPGYVPAAGHDLFLPLYDPLIGLLARERVFRSRFFEQAEIRPGCRVLDLGCGTGTMAVLIRERVPDAVVVGVDGDPKVLAIARKKAARLSPPVQFEEAFADHLPHGDASFDRVLSSLVLHHLTHEQKLAALREVRRVLVPGGAFHLADFGPPVGRYATLLRRFFGGGDRLNENFDGILPELMREAGLGDVRERGHHNTLFGTIAFYSGLRGS